MPAVSARSGNEGRKDNPIRMLERSHDRLMEEADALCAAIVAGAPREQLEEAVSFFERQGVRHERDEEESLFPRLRDRLGGTLLDDLPRQHRQHEQLCAQLRRLLDAPARETGPALLETAESLRQSYRDHIDLEENALLPAAESMLDADELAEVHAEMQARRGR